MRGAIPASSEFAGAGSSLSTGLNCAVLSSDPGRPSFCPRRESSFGLGLTRRSNLHSCFCSRQILAGEGGALLILEPLHPRYLDAPLTTLIWPKIGICCFCCSPPWDWNNHFPFFQIVWALFFFCKWITYRNILMEKIKGNKCFLTFSPSVYSLHFPCLNFWAVLQPVWILNSLLPPLCCSDPSVTDSGCLLWSMDQSC